MRLKQKVALLLTAVMFAGLFGVMSPAEVKAAPGLPFILTVPGDTNINRPGWNNLGNISVSGSLGTSDTVTVNISTANGSKLKNGGDEIPYTIKKAKADTYATSSVEFNAGAVKSGTASQAIGVDVSDLSGKREGTYTDTINFTAALSALKPVTYQKQGGGTLSSENLKNGSLWTYQGRAYEVFNEITPFSSSTWYDAMGFLKALNDAYYGGSNDWMLFNSEDMALAWDKDYPNKSLDLIRLWTGIEDYSAAKCLYYAPYPYGSRPTHMEGASKDYTDDSHSFVIIRPLAPVTYKRIDGTGTLSTANLGKTTKWSSRGTDYDLFNGFIPFSSGSSWYDAMGFVKALNDASYGGSKDWMLLGEPSFMPDEWYADFVWGKSKDFLGGVNTLWSEKEHNIGGLAYCNDFIFNDPIMRQTFQDKKRHFPNYGFVLLRPSNKGGIKPVSRQSSTKLTLVTKHDFEFTASGNTLTAKCRNHTEQLLINLAVKNKTYSDDTKNAEISGNTNHDDWTKFKLDYDFYYKDADGYNMGRGNPLYAGNYSAVVEIKENGKVKKALEKGFSIYPKTITEEFVELGTTSVIHDGKEHTNTVIVKDGDKTLKEGKDYKVSGDIKGTEKGLYKVYVEGMGNYTGKTQEEWNIVENIPSFSPGPVSGAITYGENLGKSQLSGWSVVGSDKKPVPGKLQWESPETKPQVSDSNKTEYTVEFIPDDTKVYGIIETKLTVTVNPRLLRDSDVNITVPSKYTGDDLTNFITVDLPGGTDLDLVKGTDYEVSTRPAPVIDPGDYTAVITFKGNYAGTVEKKFTVVDDTPAPKPTPSPSPSPEPSGGGSGYPSGGGSSGGSLSRPPVTTQTPVIKDDQSSQDTKEEPSTEIDIMEMLYAHPDAGKALPLIRMYNPVSGEHIMTTDINEADTLEAKHGWKREAMTGTSSKANNSPVFRLVHPATGKHIYSMNENEVRVLTTEQGWESDGVVFFAGGSNVKMYRLYNPTLPAAIAHHYTTDEGEYNTLQTQGWTGEGVAFTLD